MNDRKTIAILIDADNISPSLVGNIFKTAYSIGEPIVRRAYGMVNCFSGSGGWSQAQREYGIVARPQVSNVSGKNVADIALTIDAMEFLYKNQCQGICIVSNDSDFTAVAAKIREGGKFAYGIGGPKTPESFRVACTAFHELPMAQKLAETKKNVEQSSNCPRCGGKLTSAWTRSHKTCKICMSCGGSVMKLSALKNAFTEESLANMLAQAQRREQTGCICPDCGSAMSLLKVAVGKRHVEIDMCSKCRSVWYDKNEFESLVPRDGFLVATISAGKAYRREVVLGLSSDLKSGRRKIPDVGQLKTILKNVYHVPNPDITPIISSLMCQKIIKIDKASGKITVLKVRS